jgi:pimeloyl-ACP methyl ester carboxylesterase
MSRDVCETMQGPEWNVTGNLRSWDVTSRLGELAVPVLVTSGRYDRMTPALVEPLVTRIPGAERVVFERSAHLAMVEEPDRYRRIVEGVPGPGRAATIGSPVEGEGRANDRGSTRSVRPGR